MNYFDDTLLLACHLDAVYGDPFDTTWPDLWSVQVLVAGSMDFGRDGGGTRRLEAPAVYWIDPSHSYQLAGVDRRDRRHLVLLRGERGRALVERGFDALAPEGWAPLADPDRIDALFRLLARHLAADEPTDRAEAVILLDRILLACRAKGADADTADIGRIAATVRARPEQPYPVVRAAAELGISASHFRRRFRAAMGLPYHDWVLRVRLQAAADRLASTTDPVATVGAAVGWDDPSAFSRAFRRRYGVAPSVYRLACGAAAPGIDPSAA